MKSGAEGQARLRGASVLVVGAGGLGVPVLQYLAGAGVGRLGIVDADRLEPSNLHRQTWYALADCGREKSTLAAERVHALNPEVRVEAHALRLDNSNAERLAAGHDLILDCSDNFATKFLLNDLALRLRKPVLFASVYQYEGQLQLVRGDDASACLRCVWPEATRDGLVGNCAEAGVLGPVPGVFGSLQALEALKLLLGLPGLTPNEMLIFDLVSLNTQRLRARRAADCDAHRRAGARCGHSCGARARSALRLARRSTGRRLHLHRRARFARACRRAAAGTRPAPADVQTTHRRGHTRCRRALSARLRHRQAQRRRRQPAALAGFRRMPFASRWHQGIESHRLKHALSVLLACLLALPASTAVAAGKSADHPLLELAQELQKTRKPDLRVAPGAPGLREAEHALAQVKAPADAECAGSIGAMRFAGLHIDLALARTGQGDFTGAAQAYRSASRVPAARRADPLGARRRAVRRA